jgi:hypothetical protein
VIGAGPVRGSMKSGMILRFVIAGEGSGAATGPGFFATAYGLMGSDELELELDARLTIALAWFHIHLPVPDQSKIDPRGVFWFKADARELIQRMWAMARGLEAGGYTVELIRTCKPGYIIYEDKFQVCAVPFRDTRT